MAIRKRGDHLVATGLSKTLGDIAAFLETEAGDCREVRFLADAISQATRWLTEGEFDAVINRGRLARFDDAQSGVFGELSAKLRLEMTSLTAALKSRSSLGKDGQATSASEVEIRSSFVGTAKIATWLAMSQFVEAALDHEVAERMGPGRRGEVATARAMLGRVRQSLLQAIEKL